VSSIPPDIAGSAAQAGFVAPEAQRARAADRAAQSNLAQRQAQSLDDAAESVETDDGDTAIFTDAEGAGGQGRSLTEQEDHDQATEEEGESSEPSADDRSAPHIDFHA